MRNSGVSVMARSTATNTQYCPPRCLSASVPTCYAVILNSLDAGASTIGVSLRFSELGVRVEDNGCGIHKDDIPLLCEQFATSKSRPRPQASSTVVSRTAVSAASAASSSLSAAGPGGAARGGAGTGFITLATLQQASRGDSSSGAPRGEGSTYGYRGVSLHGIGSLGTLEITTRCKANTSSSSSSFTAHDHHGDGDVTGGRPSDSSNALYGKVVSLGKTTWMGEVTAASSTSSQPSTGAPAASPELSASASHSGTVVTARHMFASQPVRQRSLSRRDEIDRMLTAVVRMSLVHPSVAFVLRDDDDGGKEVIRIPKSATTLSRFARLYGSQRAVGLAEVTHASACGRYAIHGYVGRGHHSRELQFCYINGRYCRKTPVLQAIIDAAAGNATSNRTGGGAVTSASSVSPSPASDDSENRNPAYGSGGGAALDRLKRGESSARDALQSHLVYLINISCNHDAVDVVHEADRTLVEFTNMQSLSIALTAAVRASLGLPLTSAHLNPASISRASRGAGASGGQLVHSIIHPGAITAAPPAEPVMPVISRQTDSHPLRELDGNAMALTQGFNDSRQADGGAAGCEDRDIDVHACGTSLMDIVVADLNQTYGHIDVAGRPEVDVIARLQHFSTDHPLTSQSQPAPAASSIFGFSVLEEAAPAAVGNHLVSGGASWADEGGRGWNIEAGQGATGSYHRLHHQQHQQQQHAEQAWCTDCHGTAADGTCGTDRHEVPGVDCAAAASSMPNGAAPAFQFTTSDVQQMLTPFALTDGIEGHPYGHQHAPIPLHYSIEGHPYGHQHAPIPLHYSIGLSLHGDEQQQLLPGSLRGSDWHHDQQHHRQQQQQTARDDGLDDVLFLASPPRLQPPSSRPSASTIAGRPGPSESGHVQPMFDSDRLGSAAPAAASAAHNTVTVTFVPDNTPGAFAQRSHGAPYTASDPPSSSSAVQSWMALPKHIADFKSKSNTGANTAASHPSIPTGLSSERHGRHAHRTIPTGSAALPHQVLARAPRFGAIAVLAGPDMLGSGGAIGAGPGGADSTAVMVHDDDDGVVRSEYFGGCPSNGNADEDNGTAPTGTATAAVASVPLPSKRPRITAIDPGIADIHHAFQSRSAATRAMGSDDAYIPRIGDAAGRHGRAIAGYAYGPKTSWMATGEQRMVTMMKARMAAAYTAGAGGGLLTANASAAAIGTHVTDAAVASSAPIDVDTAGHGSGAPPPYTPSHLTSSGGIPVTRAMLRAICGGSDNGNSDSSVVGQLDKKFILALAPVTISGGSSMDRNQLVIIDQHAADERVRVEMIEAAVMGLPWGSGDDTSFSPPSYDAAHGETNVAQPSSSRSMTAQRRTAASNLIVLSDDGLTVDVKDEGGSSVGIAVTSNARSYITSVTLNPPSRLINTTPRDRYLIRTFADVLLAWGFVITEEKELGAATPGASAATVASVVMPQPPPPQHSSVPKPSGPRSASSAPASVVLSSQVSSVQSLGQGCSGASGSRAVSAAGASATATAAAVIIASCGLRPSSSSTMNSSSFNLTSNNSVNKALVLNSSTSQSFYMPPPSVPKREQQQHRKPSATVSTGHGGGGGRAPASAASSNKIAGSAARGSSPATSTSAARDRHAPSSSSSAAVAHPPSSSVPAEAAAARPHPSLLLLRCVPRLFDVTLGHEDLRDFITRLGELMGQCDGVLREARLAMHGNDGTSGGGPAKDEPMNQDQIAAHRRRLYLAGLRPPAITRILNSKACRGAIKFGDALSRDECVQLVRRLSASKLPFQCAHGRPSMVPLVTLVHMK